MEPLTARQQEVLDFIRRHKAEHGFSPSMREIGEAVGLVAPSSVAYQLGQLRLAGRLRWHPRVARSYVVVDPQAVDGAVRLKPERVAR